MRSVPFFKRRRVFRRDSAWPAALAVALSGCVFELADLVPPDGLGGIGGDGGQGGSVPPLGGGGNMPGGSTNGGGGGGNCDFGQTFCDGSCVMATPENGCGDPSCQPCAPLPQTAVACDSDRRQCIVERCELGFADCDGDTIGVPFTSTANGCEYSFGTVAASMDPLVVSLAPIVVDGNRNDWEGIAAHAIQETCRNISGNGSDCVDQVMPDILDPNTVPPLTDLEAYFRVAWSSDRLFVLVEAYDDHIFINTAGAIPDGRCDQEGKIAQCDDAFAVFLDGLDNGGQKGNDDHRVFLAASGSNNTIAEGQPPGGAVTSSLLPSIGPRCYRIEASFDWGYIVTNQLQGGAVEGKLPPLAGQTYGFDIAVSDWDLPSSGEGPAERQSQLFWKDPGAVGTPDAHEYARNTDGYGGIVLGDPPATSGGSIQ